MSEEETFVDIDLAEDVRKHAVCGKCVHYGEPDEHNFGPCKVDAFGDGYVLNARYRSSCPRFERMKKHRKVQTELQL